MKKGNYLIFPMPVINITQNYNDTYSHYPHSHGDPPDYPIDICGATDQLDGFYCPCNEAKVMRISRNTNILWLQSTEPVIFADGTEDYVSMMIIHPNDDDFDGANNCYVGRIYKRDELVVHEGTSGQASGPHIHIAVGKGKFIGGGGQTNDQGKWVNYSEHGQVVPEDAFWQRVSTHNPPKAGEYETTIIKTGGLTFKTIEGRYVGEGGTTIYVRKDGIWYNVDTVWCYQSGVGWRATTPFIYNNGWHYL